MRPEADARYLDAIRRPHMRDATAVHRDPVSGVLTPLDVEGGKVQQDATSRIRRTLSLTLPPSQATWELLQAPGGEITVRSVLRYVDGTECSIPQGVFVLDQDQMGFETGDTISLTAPDRWVLVQRGGLRPGQRSSVPTNPAYLEIKRLVEGAWPNAAYPFPGWSKLDTSAATAVGALLWDDGSRENAIYGDTGLASVNSLEVFFDGDGLAVLQRVSQLLPETLPVWTVDASALGVMIGATRVRDRSTFHNAVEATTTASDVVFDAVVVENSDPSDPLSTAGPLGYQPEQWAGPFRNSNQAVTAASARLVKLLNNVSSVTLTAAPNSALECGDVIQVVYPQTDPNTARPDELHFLDTVSVPLTPDGTQDMQTRSTQVGL